VNFRINPLPPRSGKKGEFWISEYHTVIVSRRKGGSHFVSDSRNWEGHPARDSLHADKPPQKEGEGSVIAHLPPRRRGGGAGYQAS